MSAKRIDAVVIGASAGGVDALRELMAAFEQPPSFAAIAVIHLPPNRPSGLPQLLDEQSCFPVREAMDKEPIDKGVLYLAPPDCHLLVEPDGCLALSTEPPVNFSRPAIDVLFESAAFAYRDRLLGIVMTGASADGAQGLKTVRACGGSAWVQDPRGAVADTMPQASLDVAGADRILSLSELAQALAALGRLPVLEG